MKPSFTAGLTAVIARLRPLVSALTGVLFIDHGQLKGVLGRNYVRLVFLTNNADFSHFVTGISSSSAKLCLVL